MDSERWRTVFRLAQQLKQIGITIDPPVSVTGEMDQDLAREIYADSIESMAETCGLTGERQN